MPTYNYVCECGYNTEKFLSISKRNKKFKCPECKQLLIRLIGRGSGIIFHGTGFYCTDYKKKT